MSSSLRLRCCMILLVAITLASAAFASDQEPKLPSASRPKPGAADAPSPAEVGRSRQFRPGPATSEGAVATEAPQTKLDVQIFPLKYVEAKEMGKLVRDLFGKSKWGSIYIGVDDRTNSLVVSAAATDLPNIKKVIEALDINSPRGPKNQEEVHVVRLAHARADDNLVHMLSVAAREVRIGLDPRKNELVLSGDSREVAKIVEVLKRIDVPAPDQKKEPTERQVRIVWLVSGALVKHQQTGPTGEGGGRPIPRPVAPTSPSGGEGVGTVPSIPQPGPFVEGDRPAAFAPKQPEQKDLPKPPEDLQAVVAELARIGVKDPRVVSQVVINAQVNNKFGTLGTAMLPPGDLPAQLRIDGSILDKPGEPYGLQISISAHTEGAAATFAPGRGSRSSGSEVPLCRIDTKITTPPGQAVVLGMTPTAGLTSVFVVKVLPSDPWHGKERLPATKGGPGE